MATRTVTFTDTTGGAYYAYPAHSSSTYSLANWTTHRVQLVELSAPNTGIYQGNVDDAKGFIWYVFSGASQPASWSDAVAVVDFSTELSRQILANKNNVTDNGDGTVTIAIRNDDDTADVWTTTYNPRTGARVPE